MMFELPTRLLVAYGLIALLLIAALAMVLWTVRNSRDRRDQRDRARLDERYRMRDEARAAERAATEPPQATTQSG